LPAGKLGTLIECAQCDTQFFAGGEPPEPSTPAADDNEGDNDYPPPRRPRVMLLVWALVAGLVAAVAVVVVIAIGAVNSSEHQTAKQAQAPKQAPVQPRPVRPEADDQWRPNADEHRSPSPGELGALAGAGFLCVLAFAYLVLEILLLVWVARDARNRGVDGGAVWVLIILVTGLLGLIIYVAARPHGMLRRCDICGNKRLVHAKLCPHCGRA
jgi:hypothetical protein